MEVWGLSLQLLFEEIDLSERKAEGIDGGSYLGRVMYLVESGIVLVGDATLTEVF